MTAELYLHPDGRDLDVIDREGNPRSLTAWGMVCAQSADVTTMAIVCTDKGVALAGAGMRDLAEAIAPDLVSRAQQRIRQLAAELHRQSGRVIDLAEEVGHLRSEKAELKAVLDRRAGDWTRLSAEGRAQVDRLVADNQRLRNEVGAVRRQLDEIPGLRAQAEALRAEADVARCVGRDVARLAVIALTRHVKPRRFRFTNHPERPSR